MNSLDPQSVTKTPSKARQKARPAQSQENQPGREDKMRPAPLVIRKSYRGSGKLEGKVALITGGDSGIGRAIAVHFAREGADVACVYLDPDLERADALETQRLVEMEGRKCLLLAKNLETREACVEVVRKTIEAYDRVDILVNNAARQYPREKIEDIVWEDFQRTFASNVHSYFLLTQEIVPVLKRGASIINTTSVTAYRGSSHLVDYASTKGAIVAFTRSLALQLVERGIRVNGVAPGPIWTPLIPATFPPDEVKKFGGDTPMKRAGEPCEVAPAYVFLASEDASYFTGQVLHPNGGDFTGG